MQDALRELADNGGERCRRRKSVGERCRPDVCLGRGIQMDLSWQRSELLYGPFVDKLGIEKLLDLLRIMPKFSIEVVPTFSAGFALSALVFCLF